MIRLIPAILFTCLLPFFTSCGSKKTTTLTTEQIEEIEQIGSEASLALKKNLGTQLKTALQSGGSENALHICQQIAQPLTMQTSEALPLASITRTALRVRNPDNTPYDEARAVLSEWEKILTAGGNLPPSEVVHTTENEATYYQPIITEAICLKCHGDPSKFSPELSENLAQLYPEDKAINFSEGDLRGAFRVTVALD